MLERKDVKFLKLDEPNLNGRIYKSPMMKSVIEDLKGKELFGCMEMPQEISTNFELVSHVSTNFRIIDNYVVCDIKVLDTPMGKVLEKIIDNTEFRSAGYGSVNEGVISNYKLLSINCCINPA